MAVHIFEILMVILAMLRVPIMMGMLMVMMMTTLTIMVLMWKFLSGNVHSEKIEVWGSAVWELTLDNHLWRQKSKSC
eukprot:4131584-Karenia_brevis.AAC.1